MAKTIHVGTKCRVSIRKNPYGEYEVNSYVGPNRVAQGFESDMAAARGTQKAEAEWLRTGKYADICHGGASSTSALGGTRRRKRKVR